MLELILLASGMLYGLGVAALWRSAGAGRGIRNGDAARFAAGWAALVVALLSPLDAAAERSFGMHMIQHELLMVVAAPLVVLGRPLEAWAWALPKDFTAALARFARVGPMRAAWTWITAPLGAWTLHALALWIWHLPAFFNAALASPSLHVLQHSAFFGSALAFWWAVFGGATRRPNAASVASLFTTLLHTGILGALIAFAPGAWYATDPSFLGLTSLEDQQLGGLVMCVPGGLPYLAAGLAVIARWLREPASPRSRTADSPARS